MKMTLRKMSWQEALFWLAFGSMLVVMFGFHGVRAQLAVTTLAAGIAATGVVYVMRRCRRARV